MINVRGSKSTKANPLLKHVPRAKGQDNEQWVKQQLPKADDGKLRLLLLGGSQPLHFRLRVAQSHARHDMSPSHFSHVALLGMGKQGRLKLWELALDPADGFGYPPSDNGLRSGKLGDYADPRFFPNICLLTTNARHEDVLSPARISSFRHQRAALDGVGLIHAWLGYAWGVGEAQNPLLREMGIPAAAAAEVMLAAHGVDLTPGVSSAASTPEALWQAAKWWQIPEGKGDKELERHALSGAFHVDHVVGVPPRKGDV